MLVLGIQSALAGTHPTLTIASIVGGVIIMGIGINMLGLHQIRLANLVPALVLVPLLAWAFL